MPVDDNAFLLLRTARGQAAFLHASCTEWKNLFSLEIYGRDGKLAIDGLGGSYGVERLAFYRMLPEMGPPETTIWEYPRGDRVVGARVRGVPRRHPAGPRAGRRPRRRARGARRRRSDLPTSGIDRVDAPPMIITRSPLRISLGGGGTDLPSYYREHGGFLIAAAIDKYVYVTVHAAVRAGHLSEVLEARARRARSTRCSIRSSARRSSCSASGRRSSRSRRWPTFPPAPGLGSSGSFTTALLKALYAHRRRLLHPSELAELACEIEIDRLGEPIGKQDQYIAAYGGITCFTFHPDEQVDARAAADRRSTRCSTSRTTCCCSSPASRAAPASILAGPEARAPSRHDATMLDNLHFVKELGLRSREALETGDTARVRRADARALGAQEAALAAA